MPTGVSRDALAGRIVRAARLKGSFLLRSGQTSDTYFDKYRFESDPALLRDIGRALVPLIPEGTEVLAGLELGGVPIATALSLETGLPAVYVRKARKDYGTRRIAEGRDVRGARACVVEDVITTGGQVVLSTNDLREAGAVVQDVVCVIYRGADEPTHLHEAKLRLHALFTMAELEAAAAG